MSDQPNRNPISLDESMWLYGETFELADRTVLHPDDVTKVINSITGQVVGYRYEERGGTDG